MTSSAYASPATSRATSRADTPRLPAPARPYASRPLAREAAHAARPRHMPPPTPRLTPDGPPPAPATGDRPERSHSRSSHAPRRPAPTIHRTALVLNPTFETDARVLGARQLNALPPHLQRSVALQLRPCLLRPGRHFVGHLRAAANTPRPEESEIAMRDALVGDGMAARDAGGYLHATDTGIAWATAFFQHCEPWHAARSDTAHDVLPSDR